MSELRSILITLFAVIAVVGCFLAAMIDWHGWILAAIAWDAAFILRGDLARRLFGCQMERADDESE